MVQGPYGRIQRATAAANAAMAEYGTESDQFETARADAVAVVKAVRTEM